MRIYIDADGCPVVDSTLRLAAAHRVETVILCDTSHEIQRPGVQTVTVSKGADSVDFALVNRRAAGCGAAPKGSRSRTEPSRKRWSGCCPRASQNEAAAGALAQPLMENPDIPILDVKNQEPAYSVE